MDTRTFARALLLAVLSLPIALPSGAEIYKVVDSNGTISFTNRPSNPASTQRWEPESQSLQRFASVAKDARPARHRQRGGQDARVPFQRDGDLILVNVRLNDNVVAPFYVDSACTGILITSAVSAELGLDRDEALTFAEFLTANGSVVLPKFRISSIEVGSNRVSDVMVAVNPSLEVGLLGASFLNQFVYTVDPITEMILLEPRNG